MAKAGEKNTKKSSKPQPKKRKSGEGKVNFIKVLGLVLAAFSLFTLVAVVSYFFTWEADQSLLTNPGAMGQSAAVHNLAGKLGFYWAHFLVAKCFGLGSLAIICLLSVASVKLFIRKNKWSFPRTIVLTLTAAVISSVILAFIGSLAGRATAFDGGFGGSCGTSISDWLVNILGNIITGVILLIFVVLWLLYASGGFSKWFSNLGEKESVSDRGEKVKNLPADDNTEDTAKEDDFPTWDDDIDIGDDGGDGTGGIEFVAGTEEIQNISEQGEGGGESGDGAEDAGDGGGQMEVIDAPDVPTNVKELPRINTREELNKYKFPPVDLLKDYSEQQYEVSREELERNNSIIRATLLSFGIGVERVVACKGPVVTLYKVTPSPGVKIQSIKNREEDIALALGQNGVRVVLLSDVVGIEVPNSKPSIVPLKSLFDDPAFRDSKYELPVAMGFTVRQETKIFDLTNAPHLLVAGATQQGKSVGLNVIISSLLYTKHPSEMKLVFIDPKRVEFTAYNRLLKHYLAVLPTAASDEEEKEHAIFKEPKEADVVLRSLCVEMDERYKLMSKAEVNKVTDYNDKYKDRHLNPEKGHRYLPYLVVVIDEYADLLMSDTKQMSKSISTSIVRLAQKGRAAGIHVILATQRPTVDVVTGLIKTNFPMRIAFRTSAKVDSQTILDKPGAERLIGKGDMLLYTGLEMERMQCAMISMSEISTITEFIGNQNGYKQCYNTPYYLPLPEEDGSGEGQGMIDIQNFDALFKDAAEFVVIQQKGSTSLLQRNFGVGFARAGKIMDQLEATGVVGPQDGSKPREVLIKDLDTLRTEVFAHFLK